jgi:hypothetical protein
MWIEWLRSKILMGKNTTALVLVGLLLISTLFTAFFSYYAVTRNGELRRLQMQMTSINNNQTIARALANDAVEYSKRNPAIDPILQAYGVKPKPVATTPAAKSGK